MTVTLNKNVCDRKPSCMMVALCPTGAISIKPGPTIDPKIYDDCGKCADARPIKY